ncbi:MAG: TetR/AcrR family transcriptional regulator [Halanaerobiales bacterium]|nr:TetR/AcrR family transcriptional regulator [Halanaerobiales bacterium]
MSRKSTAERKKEVLDIAKKIIYEKGFYRLTIRNISDKMNISEAAIYRHFKGKEDIIDQLTDLVFSEGCSFNIESTKNPVEVLKKFIDKQIEFFEKNPYLSIISFQDDMFREYPKIKEKFIHHQKKREDEIINLIQRGIEKNLIQNKVNPEVFASLYMGSIRLTVLKWKNSNFNYSLSDKLQEIKRELFKYLEGDY